MGALVVLKFGGTSVGSPERIRAVAKLIQKHRQGGPGSRPKIIVVVSAMGDTTDDLVALAQQVSPLAHEQRHKREMDMLLTTGERISMSLLSMALGDLGLEAISLTGSQSGIITNTVHGEAKISEIKPIRIHDSLAKDKIVIVAGFQGVSPEKEITTLGRGGSDTSAVALASQFAAQEVYIYTDVDGFYSCDPRRVKKAKKIKKLSWEEALEAASLGAQVLHPRCVELAWKNKIAINICSSFKTAIGRGTRIEGESMAGDKSLEGGKVLSIAVQEKLSYFRQSAADLKIATQLYEALVEKGFHTAWIQEQQGELSFVVDDAKKAILLEVLRSAKLKAPKSKRAQVSARAKASQGASELFEPVSRISLVGAGLMTQLDLQQKVRAFFEKEKLEVFLWHVSALSIQALVSGPVVKDRLLANLHKEFVHV